MGERNEDEEARDLVADISVAREVEKILAESQIYRTSGELEDLSSSDAGRPIIQMNQTLDRL